MRWSTESNSYNEIASTELKQNNEIKLKLFLLGISQTIASYSNDSGTSPQDKQLPNHPDFPSHPAALCMNHLSHVLNGRYS